MASDTRPWTKLAMILVVFAMLFAPVIAFSGISSNYTVNKTTQGIIGDTGESSLYSARFTTTAYQPGTYPAESENFTANIGWFNRSAGNSMPNITSIYITSNSGKNYSTDDITCYVNATDTHNLTLAIYFNWYNNSVLLPALSGITLVNTNVLAGISTLSLTNTSVGENWTCEAKAYDGYLNETDWNNASISILAAPVVPGGSAGAGRGVPPAVIRPKINVTVENVTEECIESWLCTAWSRCIDRQKQRFCIDLNNCRTDKSRPVEFEYCEEPVPVIEEVPVPVKPGIGKAVSSAKDGIINAVSAVKDGIAKSINAVKDVIVSIAKAVKSAIILAKDGIINAVSAVKDGIAKSINAVKDVIVSIAKAVISALVFAIEWMLSDVCVSLLLIIYLLLIIAAVFAIIYFITRDYFENVNKLAIISYSLIAVATVILTVRYIICREVSVPASLAIAGIIAVFILDILVTSVIQRGSEYWAYFRQKRKYREFIRSTADIRRLQEKLREPVKKKARISEALRKTLGSVSELNKNLIAKIRRTKKVRAKQARIKEISDVLEERVSLTEKISSIKSRILESIENAWDNYKAKKTEKKRSVLEQGLQEHLDKIRASKEEKEERNELFRKELLELRQLRLSKRPGRFRLPAREKRVEEKFDRFNEFLRQSIKDIGEESYWALLRKIKELKQRPEEHITPGISRKITEAEKEADKYFRILRHNKKLREEYRRELKKAGELSWIPDVKPAVKRVVPGKLDEFNKLLRRRIKDVGEKAPEKLLGEIEKLKARPKEQVSIERVLEEQKEIENYIHILENRKRLGEEYRRELEKSEQLKEVPEEKSVIRKTKPSKRFDRFNKFLRHRIIARYKKEHGYYQDLIRRILLIKHIKEVTEKYVKAGDEKSQVEKELDKYFEIIKQKAEPKKAAEKPRRIVLPESYKRLSEKLDNFNRRLKKRIVKEYKKERSHYQEMVNDMPALGQTKVKAGKSGKNAELDSRVEEAYSKKIESIYKDRRIARKLEKEYKKELSKVNKLKPVKTTAVRLPEEERKVFKSFDKFNEFLKKKVKSVKKNEYVCKGARPGRFSGNQADDGIIRKSKERAGAEKELEKYFRVLRKKSKTGVIIPKKEKKIMKSIDDFNESLKKKIRKLNNK